MLGPLGLFLYFFCIESANRDPAWRFAETLMAVGLDYRHPPPPPFSLWIISIYTPFPRMTPRHLPTRSSSAWEPLVWLV